MSAGTPISGKSGLVSVGSVDLEITGWTFDGSADESSYGSNKSEGFKRTVGGNRLGTGTVTGKITTEQAANIGTGLEEGSYVALLLQVSTDSLGTNIARAHINKLQQGVNSDSGEASTFSFQFSTDGSYEYSVGT